MSRQTDAVFAQAMAVIEDAILETAERDVLALRRELRQEMEVYTNAFYQELMFTGKFSGDRGFVKEAKGFTPLAEKTLDKKYLMFAEGKGDLDGFLNYTGNLRSHLQSRNPVQDLGKPKVIFSPGEGTGGSSDVFIDRGGRLQYSRSSGKKGFAPNELLDQVSVSLRVEIFDKAKGLPVDRLIQRMTDGWETLKLTFFEEGRRGAKGRPGQPARPFVGRFMEWYASEGLQLRINSILSQKALKK